MRFLLVLAFLITRSLALAPEEVQGMWRGLREDDPTSEAEYFFGADGRMEIRMRFDILGLGRAHADVHGDWKVNGEAIDGRITSGWAEFEGASPEPIIPETEFTPLEAEIGAGEPRSLKLTDCDFGECSVTELRYVGPSEAFSLPEVGGNTGVHRVAGRREISRSPSGRLSMKVKSGTRYFDLMGRPSR